jgi:ThiF family
MKSAIYIIGCGGVGSWLTPSLTLLTSPEQITLIDADILEEKNLDRQLFKPEDIGKSKVEALAERYGCHFMHEWFSEGLREFREDDWLIVCVDNHMARKAALNVCDRYGTLAIFAANETSSSEAYFYQREWRGTPLDPRVYFPDILTDKSNDPRARAIGCTGEAQKENPQLVTSNSMAASLAGHLFALWHLHAPTVKPQIIPCLPYRLVCNRTGMETHKIKDKLKGQENERRTGTDERHNRHDSELVHHGGQSERIASHIYEGTPIYGGTSE